MSTHTSGSPVAYRATRARPRARHVSSCAASCPSRTRAPVASAKHHQPTSSSRRGALVSTVLSSVLAVVLPSTPTAHASLAPPTTEKPVDMKKLIAAFDEAMRAGEDYGKADQAWTKAIELAPTNASAWSNRGTKRLQAGRWRDARDDLEKSIELSPDLNNPDPLTLNNLGNAEGALGNWDSAMANYLEASKDREMEAIALANFALAKFQVGDTDDALQTTRRILRRDPEFWDMRAASAAFLWADGREQEAEQEWQLLCGSGRGFGSAESAESFRGDSGQVTPQYAKELLEQQLKQQAAVVAGVVGKDRARRGGRDVVTSSSRTASNNTPCSMYASTQIVAPRWPPRCTAALDAFLSVKRTGNALDYDGETKEYSFQGR